MVGAVERSADRVCRGQSFRDEFTRLKLATLRNDSAGLYENHLDVCERIAKPETLQDMVDSMPRMPAELLSGREGKKPREQSTVNSYMRSLRAALNWAHEVGWLPERARFKPLPVDQESGGRSLRNSELRSLYDAAQEVCGQYANEWIYLIKGLVLTGLRISEALEASIDDSSKIHIVKLKEELFFRIPGRLQKNRKEDLLPITPEFAAQLQEHPTGEGWVFPLRMRNGRKGRPNAKTAGRTIAAIGKAAGVETKGGKTASAHDLRRTFGQMLIDRNLGVSTIKHMMRHSSIETTERG